MMIGASLLTIWLPHVDVLVRLHHLLDPGDGNLLLLELFDVQVEAATLLEHLVEDLAEPLDVLLVPAESTLSAAGPGWGCRVPPFTMSKSSLQIQREIASKFNIKEKKLVRLINSSRLSRPDWERINYIYEQKQSFNFVYGLAGGMLTGVGVSYLFFKNTTPQRQMLSVLVIAGAVFMVVKQRVEILFLKQVEPYFQKYEVK